MCYGSDDNQYQRYVTYYKTIMVILLNFRLQFFYFVIFITKIIQYAVGKVNTDETIQTTMQRVV